MTYELNVMELLSNDRLAMSSVPFFGKGEGSRNSPELRLSGMPGMGLLISPSL